MVQWLGLRAISVLRAQVQIKELRSYKPEKKIEGGREGGSRDCLSSWASSHSGHAELQGKGGEEERLSIELQCYMPAWMGGELGVEGIHVWLTPFTVHLKLLQHY